MVQDFARATPCALAGQGASLSLGRRRASRLPTRSPLSYLSEFIPSGCITLFLSFLSYLTYPLLTRVPSFSGFQLLTSSILTLLKRQLNRTRVQYLIYVCL